ncbi:MAG: hypothetical protein V5A55_14530 [Halovenus sp.]
MNGERRASRGVHLGKRADLVVLDWDVPKFTPSTNVSGHLVGHAAPADVGTVVVDGSILLDRGDYPTVEPPLFKSALAMRSSGSRREETGRSHWLAATHQAHSTWPGASPNAGQPTCFAGSLSNL